MQFHKQDERTEQRKAQQEAPLSASVAYETQHSVSGSNGSVEIEQEKTGCHITYIIRRNDNIHATTIICEKWS